jgi:hypothetical protein
MIEELCYDNLLFPAKIIIPNNSSKKAAKPYNCLNILSIWNLIKFDIID